MSEAPPPAPNPLAAERPTGVRWMIFGLASGTSFLLYLHRYTWGMVRPQLADEFDWDYATLSLLDSSFNLAYALGQIPFGILGDWFGTRMVLGSTILLWSVTMGATAVAGSLVAMHVVRFLFGLVQSGCYSNLSKVTKNWFPLSIRTSVQGVVSSFSGRSGAAISNIVFGSLMLGAFGMPWRTALTILTVVGVVYGLVFLVLFRSSPARHPWSNEGEARLIQAGDSEAQYSERSSVQWSVMLRSRNMWVFLFQQFTSAFADNVYQFWIPTFILIEKGVDTGAAGVLASLPLFGGAVGGLFAGLLQDRLIRTTGRRRWVRSGIGLTGKTMAAVLMYVSLGFESATTILVFFAFVKFFGDWSQPTVWGTATDIGGRNAASVFATVNMSGSLAGFVASPIMSFIILSFSQVLPVEAATIAATQEESGDAGTVDGVFQLQHRAIEEGSISGLLVRDGQAWARFSVDEARRFQFTEITGPADPDSLDWSVNWTKGRIAFTGDSQLVDVESLSLEVDYRHIRYGTGWTALFVALAIIYLASALSWIFIDCTQTLPS